MTTITGTNQSDNIVGTDGDDVINGRNGSDTIAGLAGNDIIIEGNGNDTITDGDGNNSITTGNGNSSITVGNGNNTITVGNGVNHITVGNGSDTITAGNGGNTITAGTGADTIHTGNGNDTIDAGGGNDQVFAGGGTDVVTFNIAANPGAHATGDGGLGSDTLVLELTHAQANSAAVQADIANYNAFLAANANPNTANGPAFHFTSFDLTVSNFEHLNVVIVNSPPVITSGPESAAVAEQDNTTGSAAPDTTPTTPGGTLNFTDADTGDTHTVQVQLASTSSAVPAATQADLATALTTVLHDSTGTGNGSIDWNFAIADKDLDFLSQGQTLAVDYNVTVNDGSATSTQTVEIDITGANDPVTITSGSQSDTVAEQPNTQGSFTPDSTPTHTLNFTDVDLNDSHGVNVTLDSAVWSANPSFVPADTLNDLQSALATVLNDSTGTGSGSIDWTFSIADKDLDFLGVGETLTATYDVTVSDGLTSSTQQVTITATGSADPETVNPVTATAFDNSFTDAGSVVAAGNAIVDVNDNPGDDNSSMTITAVDGNAALVGADIASTYGTLKVLTDGSYSFTANSAFDQLQVGDNPTEQHTITVTNSLGQSETTTLTFNFVGTDDAPVITAADDVGVLTEDAGPNTLVNGGFETGDLTGWSASGVLVEPLFIGNELGTYTAQLTSGSLEQDVSTVAGQHYTLTFEVAGDPDATSSGIQVFWDGTEILGQSDPGLGFTKYTFDVVGDATQSTTALQFDFGTDGSGMLLDAVSVSPTPGPAVETTDGNISFSDVETTDTHVASFVPTGSGYVGTFSLDPVSETAGTGSVAWHFSVDNADIQFLAQNQTLSQVYAVTITDSNGASTVQDVTVAINGTNDAPIAVGETVVADAGANGTIDIPGWALALNDTDPDADHVSFSHTVSASGGNAATAAGDAFFIDDSTPGGSFTYESTDGITTSNDATVTVANNATNASTLTAAASGDSILVAAANGSETLHGGAGNDVLISNGGSHTMSGGSGNDTFAFLQTSNGPSGSTITDFNNTTEHDHIAISANNFGGGLTAGQDVSSTFETSADNTFSGAAEFHFDTANQTLYFSADGTQANAHAITSVQNGVVLTAHDILVV